MTSTPLSAPPAAPAPVTRPARRSSGALLAHLGWEAVLLLAAVVLLVVVAGGLHGRPLLPVLCAQLALAGLPAVALALSLRTRSVNLAVGAIAGEAALLVAQRVGDGASFWGSAALIVVAALVGGAVIGALVGLSGVPSWAASLGLLALFTAAQLARGTRIVPLESTPGHLTATFRVLALVVIAGSLLGGVLWLLAPVRGALGGAPSDGAESLGGRVLRGTVGYAGSFALAALGGVASVLWLRSWNPSTSNDTLLFALGIALLGGVGAASGRGGVAGTALATVLLVAAGLELQLHAAAYWARMLLLGVAILVGLGVGVLFRALERELPAGAASYSGPARYAAPAGLAAPAAAPGQLGYLGQPGYPAPADPAAGAQYPAPQSPALPPLPTRTPTAPHPTDQPAAPEYRAPQYPAPQSPAPPYPGAQSSVPPGDMPPLPTRTPGVPPPAWPTPQGTNETDRTHRIDPGG